MGVIPNPKMAFIFPISCILALIFPILIKYFSKRVRKGSFPKSQIKSLSYLIFRVVTISFSPQGRTLKSERSLSTPIPVGGVVVDTNYWSINPRVLWTGVYWTVDICQLHTSSYRHFSEYSSELTFCREALENMQAEVWLKATTTKTVVGGSYHPSGLSFFLYILPDARSDESLQVTISKLP